MSLAPHDIRLRIIGGGELHEAIAELSDSLGLGNRVTLVGEVERQRVLSEIARADFLITASISEALPMTVLEAMSSGTPVIASNIEAHRYTLGESGLFFSLGDEAALARRLAELASSDTVWQLAADRVFQEAQRFSPEAFVRAYVSAIQGATGIRLAKITHS